MFNISHFDRVTYNFAATTSKWESGGMNYICKCFIIDMNSWEGDRFTIEFHQSCDKSLQMIWRKATEQTVSELLQQNLHSSSVLCSTIQVSSASAHHLRVPAAGQASAPPQAWRGRQWVHLLYPQRGWGGKATTLTSVVQKCWKTKLMWTRAFGFWEINSTFFL